MKVGILTYHRSQNYGAILQAKGMQEFLKSLGHEVAFIDYYPDYLIGMYQPFYWPTFRKKSLTDKISYLLRFFLTYRAQNQRGKKTQALTSRFLNVTSERRFDIVVYGSDQIWRKQWGLTDDFDSVYYGNGYVEAPIKIAYAASMGKLAIDSDKDREFVRQHLSNFTSISVRENNLAELLNKEFGKEYQIVCDPVFLLNKQQWRELMDDSYLPSYKYIFYYRLAAMKQTDYMVDQLANKTGLKVIEVRSYMPLFFHGERYRMTADAQEFITLLNGAEYVITSSFHGLAFSVICEKQFLCTCNEALSNRQKTLLKEIELENRFVKDEDISLLLNSPIDYEKVKPLLYNYISKSKSWFLSNLEEKYIL